MHKQDIQKIVDAASETADTIVGARQWRTAEVASAMHDVIFWDMLAKQLPNISIAELLSILN
jgi:phosphoribosyl-ATP pyrophosphohydrolase